MQNKQERCPKTSRKDARRNPQNPQEESDIYLEIENKSLFPKQYELCEERMR